MSRRPNCPTGRLPAGAAAAMRRRSTTPRSTGVDSVGGRGEHIGRSAERGIATLNGRTRPRVQPLSRRLPRSSASNRADLTAGILGGRGRRTTAIQGRFTMKPRQTRSCCLSADSFRPAPGRRTAGFGCDAPQCSAPKARPRLTAGLRPSPCPDRGRSTLAGSALGVASHSTEARSSRGQRGDQPLPTRSPAGYPAQEHYDRVHQPLPGVMSSARPDGTFNLSPRIIGYWPEHHPSPPTT